MRHEVVAALMIRSRRILLGRRSARRTFYPNVWDVFGGHVEPGETHEQTLVRELQEELGITPAQWTFLETIRLSLPHLLQSPETDEEMIVHLYLVTGWIGTPTNRQPEEHSTIGWFSLDQATQLNLADPIYPSLFARYLDQE